jgi:hypothetical protein
MQHSAGSFGPSPIAYGLTKLLLYWHDTRQRLPIRRLLCPLDISKFDSLTVSRTHVNVYKVFRVLKFCMEHFCASYNCQSFPVCLSEIRRSRET